MEGEYKAGSWTVPELPETPQLGEAAASASSPFGSSLQQEWADPVPPPGDQLFIYGCECKAAGSDGSSYRASLTLYERVLRLYIKADARRKTPERSVQMLLAEIESWQLGDVAEGQGAPARGRAPVFRYAGPTAPFRGVLSLYHSSPSAGCLVHTLYDVPPPFARAFERAWRSARRPKSPRCTVSAGHVATPVRDAQRRSLSPLQHYACASPAGPAASPVPAAAAAPAHTPSPTPTPPPPPVVHAEGDGGAAAPVQQAATPPPSRELAQRSSSCSRVQAAVSPSDAAQGAAQRSASLSSVNTVPPGAQRSGAGTADKGSDLGALSWTSVLASLGKTCTPIKSDAPSRASRTPSPDSPAASPPLAASPAPVPAPAAAIAAAAAAASPVPEEAQGQCTPLRGTVKQMSLSFVQASRSDPQILPRTHVSPRLQVSPRGTPGSGGPLSFLQRAASGTAASSSSPSPAHEGGGSGSSSSRSPRPAFLQPPGALKPTGSATAAVPLPVGVAQGQVDVSPPEDERTQHHGSGGRISDSDSVSVVSESLGAHS
eukprot:m51a1_g1490 hypothetical protein (545) ;mRNA; r:317239-319460